MHTYMYILAPSYTKKCQLHIIYSCYLTHGSFSGFTFNSYNLGEDAPSPVYKGKPIPIQQKAEPPTCRCLALRARVGTCTCMYMQVKSSFITNTTLSTHRDTHIHTRTCWCLEDIVFSLFCFVPLPPPDPVAPAPFEEEEERRPFSLTSMMSLTCSVMESRERPERVLPLLRRTSCKTLLKSSLQVDKRRIEEA